VFVSFTFSFLLIANPSPKLKGYDRLRLLEFYFHLSYLIIYLWIFCIGSIWTWGKAPWGLMNCWRICFWWKPLGLNHLLIIIVGCWFNERLPCGWRCWQFICMPWAKLSQRNA